jgi:hypothetical protein
MRLRDAVSTSVEPEVTGLQYSGIAGKIENTNAWGAATKREREKPTNIYKDAKEEERAIGIRS